MAKKVLITHLRKYDNNVVYSFDNPVSAKHA